MTKEAEDLGLRGNEVALVAVPLITSPQALYRHISTAKWNGDKLRST